MKSKIITSVFFLLFTVPLFIALGQITETSSENSGTIITDSIYSVDSIRLRELHLKIKEYYENNEQKKVEQTLYEIKLISDKLITYRQDSIIHLINYMNFFRIGNLKFTSGEFEEGLSICLEAIELTKKRFGGLHVRLQEGYVGLANKYASMGDYEMAIICNKTGLDLYNRTKNDKVAPPYYFGNFCNNIALHYRKMGKYNLSLEYFEKALKNYEEDWPIAIPAILYPIGDLYVDMEEYDLAIENYLSSLEEIGTDPHRYKYHRYLIRTLTGLGKAYKGKQDLDRAELYFKKAIKVFNTSKASSSEKMAVSAAYYHWADLKIQKKKYAAAIQLCKIAFGYNSELYSPHFIGGFEILMKLIEAIQKKGEWKIALLKNQELMHQLVKQVPETDYTKNPSSEKLYSSIQLFEVLSRKSQLLSALYFDNIKDENYELAVQTIALTSELADKILSRQIDEQSKILFTNKLKSFYTDAVNFYAEHYFLNQEQQSLERVFFFMEKSKVALLKLGIQGKELEIASNVPSLLVKNVNEIKHKIDLLQKFIYDEENENEKPDNLKIGSWNSKILAYKISLDSLESTIVQQYDRYYLSKKEFSIASINDIKKVLSSEEILLEYFVGKEYIYSLIISANDNSLYRFDNTKEFNSQIESVLSFTKHPNLNNSSYEKTFNDYIIDARSLFKKLFIQSEILASKPNVIIIPDGKIGFIPFEVLLFEDPSDNVIKHKNYRNLPYAINKFSYRYEYSADFLLKENSIHNTNNSYVGFAPEYKGTKILASRSVDSAKVFELYPEIARNSLSSLKYNLPEVETATRYLNGISFLGQDAQESTFKEFAPEKGVLHLAMHALTNDKNPLYSQLVFSENVDDGDDGILYAYELYNMRLKANLAVLSACDTGSGKLQEGEGIMSLSRAFKYAGCPNVVMSLWKANDKTTKDIIVDFYGNLKEGLGKGEALKNAKLNFLSTCDQQHTHPYYWATFVLIGDNEPINFGRVWWVNLLIITGILGMLFFVYKWLRKKQSTSI